MADHAAPYSPKVSPELRTWLYGVALAALAVLAAYKVIGPDEVPVWAQVVEAVLGVGATGTALAYRPTRREIHADGTPAT